MTDLFAILTELVGMVQAQALAGFVVFLRVGAVMLLLPAFAEQVVPMRIKLGVTIAFTLVVTPAISDQIPKTDQFPAILFATETISGLLLGFGIRAFVFALQIVGAIAAQATTLSQMFGGIGPEPQPIIGNVLLTVGLAAAVATGLHVRVAEAIILSYGPLPLGQLPNPADVINMGLSQVSWAFSTGFTLAAPFVIASVLYNIALGFINRAMPQLAVSFIGAPALTLGSLILLAIAAPIIVALWLNLLNAYLDNPMVPLP